MSSCAQFLTTDELISKYSKEFEHIIDQPGKTALIPIVFRTQRPGVAGTCHLVHIELDPTFFFDFSTTELEKKNLVFHEYGHCVCGLGHTDDTLEDGCPASLMHKSVLGNICLQRHWAEYLIRMRKDCSYGN